MLYLFISVICLNSHKDHIIHDLTGDFSNYEASVRFNMVSEGLAHKDKRNLNIGVYNHQSNTRSIQFNKIGFWLIEILTTSTKPENELTNAFRPDAYFTYVQT